MGKNLLDDEAIAYGFDGQPSAAGPGESRSRDPKGYEAKYYGIELRRNHQLPARESHVMNTTIEHLVRGACIALRPVLPTLALPAEQDPASFKGVIGTTAANSTPDWPARPQAPLGAPNILI